MPNDSTPAAVTGFIPDSHTKPFARHLPIASSAPDLVPARMINEVLYCERRLVRSTGATGGAWS
jgi:hypothetical protein